jgi:hypothetical protein
MSNRTTQPRDIPTSRARPPTPKQVEAALADKKDATNSWRPLEELYFEGPASSSLLYSELYSDVLVRRAGAMPSEESSHAHKAMLHAAPPLRALLSSSVVSLPLSPATYRLVLRRAYGWSMIGRKETRDFSLVGVLDACLEVAAWGWRSLAEQLWIVVRSMILQERRAAVVARCVGVASLLSLPLIASTQLLDPACLELLSAAEMLVVLASLDERAVRCHAMARVHPHSVGHANIATHRSRRIEEGRAAWLDAADERGMSEDEKSLILSWRSAV